MKIIIIFWILFEVTLALDNKHLQVTKSVNDDYINAVQFVLDKVLFQQQNRVNLITAAKIPINKRINDFKDALVKHRNTSDSNYVFKILNYAELSKCPRLLDEKNEVDRQKCNQTKNNIFIIDSLESFALLNKSLVSDIFNMRGHYLVLFPLGKLSVNENQIIIKSMWTKSIYNLNLMYEEGGVINMTTFWPFRDGLCFNTTEVSVDIHKNGSFIHGNVHKVVAIDKFKNLHNCGVKVVTFHRCPAVCYNKTSEEKYGYDLEVINELSKRLNFTIEENFLYGYQKWGTMHSNNTVSGALDILNRSLADIGIGNYYLRFNRLSFLDATVSYYSTPVVLVVPPGKPYTSFEKLLQPFDIVIWIFLIITFSIGFFTIIVINLKFKSLKVHVYGKKVNDPMMNMLAAILGLQQNILPKSNFSRFILMMFLIFCLVLRNVYQGALFTFLQSDGRHKQIESIDEMVEKKYIFYNIETDISFIYGSQGFKRQIIYDESDLPFNRRVDHTLNATFMTTIIDIIYRNKKNQGRLALNYAKNPVTTMSIVMYLKRNFYLKNALDEKIRLFDSAGLITHWTEEYASKRYLNIVDDVAPKQLNLDHLCGIFTILIIGNISAFVIFILELIIHKMNQVRGKRVKLFRRNSLKLN